MTSDTLAAARWEQQQKNMLHSEVRTVVVVSAVAAACGAAVAASIPLADFAFSWERVRSSFWWPFLVLFVV